MLLSSVHAELSLDHPAGLDVGQSPKEVILSYPLRVS